MSVLRIAGDTSSGMEQLILIRFINILWSGTSKLQKWTGVVNSFLTVPRLFSHPEKSYFMTKNCLLMISWRHEEMS